MVWSMLEKYPNLPGATEMQQRAKDGVRVPISMKYLSLEGNDDGPIQPGTWDFTKGRGPWPQRRLMETRTYLGKIGYWEYPAPEEVDEIVDQYEDPTDKDSSRQVHVTYALAGIASDMANNAQAAKRRAVEVEEEELPIPTRIMKRPVPDRSEGDVIEPSKGKKPVNKDKNDTENKDIITFEEESEKGSKGLPLKPN